MSEEIHEQILRQTFSIPSLHTLIQNNGVIMLAPKPPSEFFDHLAKTVINQQLSKAAAATIENRLRVAAQQEQQSLQDYCTANNRQAIRNCGLSQFKTKALIELSEHFQENPIPQELFNTNNPDVVVNYVEGFWGFGRWSAEMIAMFFFAMPNIWSEGDAALSRGIARLSDRSGLTKAKLLKTAKPYQTYLALHIWKGLDEKKL